MNSLMEAAHRTGEKRRHVFGCRRRDGSLDIADAARILEALFSHAGRLDCEDAAGVNDDGLIDVSDAVFELLALAGAGEPPAPGPLTCGDDSTHDALDCDAPVCGA